MATYQRKTKSYLVYTSGLISLVLLPLFSYWYIKAKYNPKKYYAMEVVLPDPPTNDTTNWMSISNFPKGYNETLTLTGEENSDLEKLNYIRTKLDKLIRNNDSSHTIHVLFGDKAKYWSMIRLFDICNFTGLDRYAMYENEFWAVYTHKPQNLIEFEVPGYMCGTGTMMHKPNNDILSRFDIIKEEISFFADNLKFIWPSIILFFLMLVLTLRRLFIS